MRIPESRWADLDGPVHWIDFAGPSDAPVAVCVHGLGGCHLNWISLAPLLARQLRVVAVDLAGFGGSPGAGRSTTVGANARLLGRFIRQVLGEPAVVIGNSMGALAGMILAQRAPRLVSELVLLDPVLPWAPGVRWEAAVAAPLLGSALPGVGRAYLDRLGRSYSVRQIHEGTVRLCYSRPERVSREVTDLHVRYAESRGPSSQANREYVVAVQSLVGRMARPLAFRAMIDQISVPVHLIHGDRDRLIPVRAARAVAARRPAWHYDELPDIGHVPQLEAPDLTAERILARRTDAGQERPRALRDGLSIH